VLLHDKDDTPLVKDRGFKVSPGFVTQVAVEAQYVSSLLLVSADFVFLSKLIRSFGGIAKSCFISARLKRNILD
jgi:hypothetical protein